MELYGMIINMSHFVEMKGCIEMKRMLALLGVCLMAAVLTACRSAEADGHVHAPSDWMRDPKQHWQECACGEKLDEGAHSMQDVVCSVCGSEIWAYDDGMTDIYNYSETGEPTRNSVYDADGNLLDDYVYLYEYDAEGRMLRMETYYFDKLVEEVDFAVSADGESIPSLQIGYYDEGARSVNEYDEYGNVVRMAGYNADDELIFEETISFVYDDQGNVLSDTRAGLYADGSSYLYVHNEHGDQVKCIFREADGSIVYDLTCEFVYDENGYMLYSVTYDGERLLDEAEYKLIEDEYGTWSCPVLVTEYMEDGSYTVYEYDENGEELSAVAYNADGSIAVLADEETPDTE